MSLPPNPTAEKAAATKERKERFTTLGGIPLKTVYTREDLAGQNDEAAIGVPGEFPYTRGSYPTMYRGRRQIGHAGPWPGTCFPRHCALQ